MRLLKDVWTWFFVVALGGLFWAALASVTAVYLVGCSSTPQAEQDIRDIVALIAENIPEEYRPAVQIALGSDPSLIRQTGLGDQVVAVENAIRTAKGKDPLTEQQAQVLRGAVSALQVLAVMEGLGAPEGK